MGYKNNIYYIIKTKYFDKEQEIVEDFKRWVKGEYDEPKTLELKEILKNANTDK